MLPCSHPLTHRRSCPKVGPKYGQFSHLERHSRSQTDQLSGGVKQSVTPSCWARARAVLGPCWAVLGSKPPSQSLVPTPNCTLYASVSVGHMLGPRYAHAGACFAVLGPKLASQLLVPTPIANLMHRHINQCLGLLAPTAPVAHPTAPAASPTAAAVQMAWWDRTATSLDCLSATSALRCARASILASSSGSSST